ncbi:MAG: electron transfer flavoprotein subunit alpha/FixB family protein [Dethiobacter sp.]|jgi:electron transfer flavoprotein alpha subunit|nr:electron transfer flavoprotein subunit alpha/FixB family protein [Dethiobacter sp.]
MIAQNNVWVYAQETRGGIAGVTLELLGEGRRLADRLSVKLTAVLCGEKVAGLTGCLFAAGADTVILVENPSLHYYNAACFGHCLEGLARRYHPQIFLFGATQQGKDLAAVTAARLNAGLTAHCTAFELDDGGRLRQMVPAFGGRCVFVSTGFPQMATVAPGVFQRPDLDWERRGEVVREQFTGDGNTAVKVLNFLPSPRAEKGLADAAVIVAAGAGVGGSEGYALVEELAALLNGVMGATRPAVDEGWALEEQMIGQSGCNVHPKLYIAVGVSGDQLHLSGVKDPDVFIAINKDRQANIFRHAHYGVIADFKLIIPRLIDLLKSRTHI